MHTRASSVDHGLEAEPIARDAVKLPLHVVPVACFLQVSEDVLLSIVPEHSLAKDQAERHVVDQRFQGGRRLAGPWEVRVCPGPEAAMPVSAIVSLHSEAQRVSGETPAIEGDLPEKKRIGVRRARETNPAFVAQRYAKRRTVVQVPGDRVPINLQGSVAGIFSDPIVANSKVKRSLPFAAEIQALQRKSLNEGLRLRARREPSSPYLSRLRLEISIAAASPRIHQQITEPPCTIAVRQSHPNKPHFVPATDRQSGEHFV